jgi:lipoate-protein ligase B
VTDTSSVNAVTSIRAADSAVEVRRLGTIDYLSAWQLQREIAEARIAGGPDTLLLLEHPAVYTAGKRTEPHERRWTARPSSTPTAAARSPGTAPVSWWAIRSWA